MKKNIFLLLFAFSISFASTVVIYNGFGFFEDMVTVNKTATVVVPRTILPDSFYSDVEAKLTFVPAKNISLESILSTNKFIYLNHKKYEVISSKPLILKFGSDYIYNPDIKGFSFSSIPLRENPKFVIESSFKKLRYSYLFKGISYELKYIFDDGRITSFLEIKNDTDYDFKDDTVYITTQKIKESKHFNSDRLLLKSASQEYSPEKSGENYLYKIGKLDLPADSYFKVPFISDKVKYTTYYKYYPTPSLSELKTVISFKTSKLFPSGEWIVSEKNKDVVLFSSPVNLGNFSKQENVEIEYGPSYDLKGMETILKSVRNGKAYYKTFKDTIYNHKDKSVTVKIYKNARNAILQNYDGKYERIGDFLVFILQIAPNSGGDISYTLKYSY